MVMEEDMGDGNIRCTNHPYQNSSSPGGICAFCLQEKLGKLVSSSFPSSIFPSSSSTSSPSFRSDFVVNSSQNGCYNKSSMSKPPLVSSNKNINAKNLDIPFNRSKSIATPSRGVMHLLDENYAAAAEDYSPRRRRKFWSFLHLTSTTKKNDSLKREKFVVVEENSPTNFDGKVSRSRSVGCGGSRSFSFGDCSTLRRVESQREGITIKNNSQQQDCGGGINEKVKCGGIFSGFMITSSSSSSSNWESSNGRRMSAVHSSFVSSHGRSKSWGWALASPIRAFTKPSSSVKRGDNNNSTKNPDLNAIPSLLSI